MRHPFKFIQIETGKNFAVLQFLYPRLKFSATVSWNPPLLSAFIAASQGRGKSAITENDRKEAANVIKDGMGTSAFKGIKNAVENTTKKMTDIMQKSIDTTQKSVWSLFGLGDAYDRVYRGKGKSANADGASNMPIGHLHKNEETGVTREYIGGDPKSPASWKVVSQNNSGNSDPLGIF